MSNKYNLLLSVFLMSSVMVFAQIPAGYYNQAQGLSGEALKDALHNIIKNHDEYSYNNLRDFILKNTDEDPDNSNNVILLYTGRSQAKSTFGGGANDWNREHVWAKSHGDFGNNPPAGTDAHHIRPTDASVNSSRGNLDFDMGGSPVQEAPGCFRDSDSFEPRDAVKGDVARMIFYMATRYDGGDGAPDLEVVDAVNTSPNPKHGKLSQLILWNSQDPPDDFEKNRNDVIYYQYQNNRNPFIDHPEYVDAIWGDPTFTESSDDSMLSVYPNPSSGFLNIKSSKIGIQTFEIYSIVGQQILKGNIETGTTSVDVTMLLEGIYSIVISNASDRNTTSTTFIKTTN